jgi:plastocyanin
MDKFLLFTKTPTGFITIGACICICIFIVWLYVTSVFSETAIEHQMIVTSDGFAPEQLTISAGDTVSFTTDMDVYFWPASNQHPAHDIYPEFDPQRPLSPEESWEFTFTKKAIWHES